MIDAAIIENVFALGRVRPFEALTEKELLLVAQHTRARSFDSGAQLIKAGDISETLFIRTEGDIFAGGVRAPDLFDAPSVLFSRPARADYCAGPAGLKVLCLTKPHLFTITRECPDFILGITDSLGQS